MNGLTERKNLMGRRGRFPGWLLIILFGLAAEAQGAASRQSSSQAGGAGSLVYQSDIKPLLTRYCYGCHGEKKKGDLDLRIYTDEAAARNDPKEFEKVLHNLQAREMPPENKPQPTTAERARMAKWVEINVLGCDCNQPDPGRVTLRRLNRTEYNNTIRELTGVTFQPADDFPADDVGYGFDNIGDVLSVSPILLEEYLSTAEKIMSSVMTNASSEAYQRIFIRQPTVATTNAVAREIIANFARRAYRRPVTERELEGLLRFTDMAQKDGESFETGIKLALEAVLVSPNFLFRDESQPEPDNPQSIHPIDEYALATRLSYFLWSSMPDEELFKLAGQKKLRANLTRQVQRMLKDPKADALVVNFADQWLQIRNLANVTPDPKTFPEFNNDLRNAMNRETELFTGFIIKQDRSVLEFLEANYTFLNERLAKHYGIEGVQGDEFRRVDLKGDQRGGLLTQASILTITSNPTRTSPVKRGRWVLENLLAAPPPPPPPNVPILKEGKEAALKGTMRQRMEQHRADPNCASCHARMDPIGFGLENYDAIGAWRMKEGNFAIDSSGQLATGESFRGAADLKSIMIKRKKEAFVQCLSEKMLTYALGRGLEQYDKCALDSIVQKLARNRYRFSSLVMEIVQSAPFQMRRGELARPGQQASDGKAGE
ncbi:MAG: Protein of unknown function (DUF1587)/Protein of unknown function (DUF1592)/Protein of unknown [Pedosphaera sp.]|nr:Protein of unknown function (DUF1587)/Protein of unknown function (DUF1592)/Protein of unknown [Pedosphaera sp.]